MSKKRILIVLPDKIKNPVGGLGVQCANLMSRLESVYDFDIVGQPEENGMSNYVSVHNPLPEVPHASLITAIAQIAYFGAGAQMLKPDIVHAYDWSTYLSGIYLAKHFKVPLVVTMQLSVNLLERSGITYCHEFNTQDGFWIHKAHCQTEVLGLREADRIIHVSKEYMDYFAPLGLDEKSVIVPNGIDLAEWSSWTKKELPGKGRIKLVYIGRMALMKGVLALCQAHIPLDIDLIFIGKSDGGEGNVFEAMMNKTKNESNVHYLGPLFGQDKIDALRSADAVIMPSVHEPFGIVALEALASESILLSSFADGMKDFLTEDVAINCGSDVASIELALARLSHMTEEEKTKRKKKGLETAQKYSWEAAAEMTKKVYESVIN